MARAGSKLARYEEDAYLLRGAPALELLEKNTHKNFEKLYGEHADIAKRKRLGQFFTPDSIASVMADWVVKCSPKSIIDPAVGTGVLLRKVFDVAGYSILSDVFDIDEDILGYFRMAHPHDNNIKIRNEDFLSSTIHAEYDAVIMNPPYLRHQDMYYDHNMHDRISELVGAKISRSANAYVLFVMKACHHLKSGGRGAFIIPSEWANANFGENFKKYLMDIAGLSEIIYFTNCASVFDDALTTASILLVEKGTGKKSISVSCVDTTAGSFDHKSVEEVQKTYMKKEFSFKTLKALPKWDGLFRYGEATAIAGFISLSNLGVSKRGIATGANKYFHITELQASSLSSHHKKPCVGRSADVTGLIFSLEDFECLKNKGGRSVLLDFSGELSDADRSYIESGEDEGLNDRYLLSKRTPWFSMEKREPAPVWAAVFGRKSLRFIHNEAQVKNLTTFHGFYPHNNNETFIRALVCTLNSEVVQEIAKANMRVYGGGLLKFEPKDILDIQIPDIRMVKAPTLEKLASMLNKDVSAQELNTLVHQAALEAIESNA